MNIRNKHEIIIKILISLLVILSGICIYQWKIIGNYSEEVRVNSKAISNSFKMFVHYQDKIADIEENLDTCVFPIKRTLIYRFSEDMCDECIQQDLCELSSFQQRVGKYNLLILPAYDEKRKNHIFLQNTLHDFQFKNLADSIIAFPIHRKTGEQVRYIAYVDKEGKVSSIFYPIKNQQSLTQAFLYVMESRFK